MQTNLEETGKKTGKLYERLTKMAQGSFMKKKIEPL